MIVQFEGTLQPINPQRGSIWHDTTTQTLFIYDGKVWNHMGYDLRNKYNALVDKMPLQQAIDALEHYKELQAALEWNEIVKHYHDKLLVALKMIREDTK